jgi:hypothetical protein
MEKALLVAGLLLLSAASVYLMHREQHKDDISSEVIDAF